MDENMELLEYIYQNSEMGVNTLTKLLRELNGKDNKIKVSVEESLKEYERICGECKILLKENATDIKENSFMTKMMANMGVKNEVSRDNSDTSIAHMILEGITMGLVDITTKIKEYENKVAKEHIKIAKDYKRFLEESEELYKEYL